MVLFYSRFLMLVSNVTAKFKKQVCSTYFSVYMIVKRIIGTIFFLRNLGLTTGRTCLLEQTLQIILSAMAVIENLWSYMFFVTRQSSDALS